MDYEAEVVSVDTGTPVETPTEVAEPQPEVAETVETVEEETIEPTKEPEKAEETLVELPDGRKLPPKEAETEYRKLYSDYTRKSQKLATYEKGNANEITNQEPTENEWEPQSWSEVLERAATAYEEKQERLRQEEASQRQANEATILEQLAELEKENPGFNKNQLFEHALKYTDANGVPIFGLNMKAAYQNMKDMHAIAKKATDMTVQNLQKRNADPISGGQQSGAVMDGDVYDPSVRNMSMVEYLRSMK